MNLSLPWLRFQCHSKLSSGCVSSISYCRIIHTMEQENPLFSSVDLCVPASLRAAQWPLQSHRASIPQFNVILKARHLGDRTAWQLSTQKIKLSDTVKSHQEKLVFRGDMSEQLGVHSAYSWKRLEVRTLKSCECGGVLIFPCLPMCSFCQGVGLMSFKDL